MCICDFKLRSYIGCAALLVGRSRGRFPVVSLDFSVTYSLRPYHGPGVDSVPRENEYQKYFLAAGAWGWRTHQFRVPNVMKSWSLNLLEPSGLHRACYGTPYIRWLIIAYSHSTLIMKSLSKCVEKRITVDWLREDGINKCRNASEYNFVCDLLYTVWCTEAG